MNTKTLVYVLKRVALAVLTVWVVITVTFFVMRAVPGGPFASEKAITPAAQAALEAKYGLDKPVMEQYFTYLKDIVTKFDFGTSWYIQFREPALNLLLERLTPTVLVNTYSLLLSVPIGILLGIYAAIKKNKWQDQVINIFIILLISVPSIVLALMIQYVFCFKLGWFPLTMSVSNEYFTWPVFRSMLPAVFALCLGSIAGYARYTRAELSEVLTGEFMLLARTKGLTKRQAIYRHAMRNSMVVIFPSILSEFISVLSGSLIIEKMFGINGVGGLYLNSITFQDYDFFMLLSGFYTLVSLTAGIVIDISYGFIDPRIRMGAK